MPEVDSDNPFAAPKVQSVSLDISLECLRVRTGLRLWLFVTCIHLANGVVMQFLFWQLSPSPGSGVTQLLAISHLVTWLIRLIEIVAAVFFLRVPASTGTKTLSKLVLAFSILMPLLTWLIPVLMFRAFDDVRVISITFHVATTAYAITVLVFMLRIASHHERQEIVSRAKFAILLRVLLTLITLGLLIIATEMLQSPGPWSLLFGLCGSCILAIEISVVYQLLDVAGRETDSQSPDADAWPSEQEN